MVLAQDLDSRVRTSRELPVNHRGGGGRTVTIVACTPLQGLDEARAARSRRRVGTTYRSIDVGNTLLANQEGLVGESGLEMVVVNTDMGNPNDRIMALSPVKKIADGIQVPVLLIEEDASQSAEAGSAATSTRAAAMAADTAASGVSASKYGNKVPGE